MDENRNLSETGSEQARPRRRSAAHRQPEGTEVFPQPEKTVILPQEEGPLSAQKENTPAEPPEKTAGTGETPLRTQGSRIPPEARQMGAAPYGNAGAAVYGAAGAAAHKRPGTRPMQAPRRPAPEPRRHVTEIRRPDPEKISPYQRPQPSAQPSAGTDGTRPFEPARVSVGYAPGRMGGAPRMAPEYEKDARPSRENVRSGKRQEPAPETRRNTPAITPRQAREVYGQETYAYEPRDPRRIGVMPGVRYEDPRPENPRPENSPDRQGKKHTVLNIAAAALLALGLLLTVLLCLPAGNSVRTAAADIVRKVTDPVENIIRRKDPARIDSYTASGTTGTAPGEAIFSVTTDSTVTGLRLVDEDGHEVPAEIRLAENTGNNVWTMTMTVPDGYEGTVYLQARRGDGEWEETVNRTNIAIAPPIAAPDGANAETKAEIPPEDSGVTEAAESAGAENAGAAIPADGTQETAAPEAAAAAASEPAGYGDEMWGQPWDGTLNTETEAEPEPTPAPTEEPAPTETPSPTPPLTVEAADPSADPALITSTIVYDGKKKVKEYMRPAKSLIHMPAGDDYTKQKIGVLTFRGNAFRQNAAVGRVESASDLETVWQVEAGSLRGAGQMFYGFEWTGQPAIVKWSSQVREGSNIDEEKKTKSDPPLREVIIAGADGVIRFIDLDDGSLTRAAINFGYPFRGTPSLHPIGYPYMSVGQYTRRLKSKTGKYVGLRQYNLYTQKEITLIDGLDGKLHRNINKYGSFETSALIDRNSDTLVTVGTNGLLYLVSLDTDFDYKMGTLKTNPSVIVMSSRAKGEKKDERVAVESSHAMYDRYVYYADMGGVLRCVDTNYLKPVWAVNTEDSVMAAVALDLNGSGGLDLYTANMLSIRKKGSAQIRKFDAMSGKLLWMTEIGVAKNTKTKEDVGVKASPVIGQNGLDGLVFFTVTGLNEEGRATLGVGAEDPAAVVALEKESGKVRWAKGLSSRSESSPVAVYDRDGNGRIIQCAEDGTILLLDGETGDQLSELHVDGMIQASPAVYNDMLVIGTTGKGTSFVYGIRIK